MKRSNPFEDSPEPDSVNRLEAFLKSPIDLEIDKQQWAARARAEVHKRAWRRRSRFRVTLLCSEDGLTELVKRVLKPPFKVVAFSKLHGSGFVLDVLQRSSIVILRPSPTEMGVTLTFVLGLIRKLQKLRPRIPTIVLGETGLLTGQAGTEDFEPDAWLCASKVESDLESMVLKLIPPDPDESAAD
jgi:hypothetical protein